MQFTTKLKLIFKNALDKFSPGKRNRQDEEDEAESLPRSKRPTPGPRDACSLEQRAPPLLPLQPVSQVAAAPQAATTQHTSNSILASNATGFAWLEVPPPTGASKRRGFIKRHSEFLGGASLLPMTPRDGQNGGHTHAAPRTSTQIPPSRSLDASAADLAGRDMLARAVNLQHEHMSATARQPVATTSIAPRPSSVAMTAVSQSDDDADIFGPGSYFGSRLIESLRRAVEKSRGLGDGDEMVKSRNECQQAMRRAEQAREKMTKEAKHQGVVTSVFDDASVREKEREADELREKLEAFKIQRERKVTPLEIKLTQADRDTYLKSIKKPSDTILVTHKLSGIDVKGHDMAKLEHGCWLNDELINVYVSMLQERDSKQRDAGTGEPFCHFFNSYFAAKLYLETGQYDYNAVRRWTLPKRLKITGQRSESILDCDRVIIPVNKGGMHWVCAMIDLKNCKFVFYDSLGGRDPALLNNLAKYLQDEYKNKRNEERSDVADWPHEYPEDTPQQQNGVDCGVFTVLFADYAGRDAAFNFTQKHINDVRIRMCRDILRLHVD